MTLTTRASSGLGTHIPMPLDQAPCMDHQDEVPALLSLNVKDKHFYYLLEEIGHFLNTQPFDNTVGTYWTL